MTKAVILLTGSELTRGDVRDANGPFLAAQLARAGVIVDEIRLLPDEHARIRDAVATAVGAADVVLVSGGLGPTSDDVTVLAIAEALGRTVARDEASIGVMRERALRRGVAAADLPANYFKQAEVVAGAEVLPNPVGLAPGSLCRTPRGFLASMPGVPRELEAMFEQSVLPAIAKRFTLAPPWVLRAKVFGLGESWVETRIAALDWDRSLLTYGISARPGEITLHFESHDADASPALTRLGDDLRRAFGEALVWLEPGDDPRLSLALIVHRELLRTGRTVATAESCTGGGLAQRLTDNPGSSAYFRGGVVAYDDAVKRDFLGVPAALLKEHGAVSREVAAAMADAARSRFEVDFGIGITGIAGPGGGSDDKPVGLVFAGVASRADTTVAELRLGGDRGNIRELACMRALDILRQRLTHSASRDED